MQLDPAVVAQRLAKAKREGECLVFSQNGRAPQTRIDYRTYNANWLAYWLWVDDAIDVGTPVYRRCLSTQCIEPGHLTLDYAELAAIQRPLRRAFTAEDVEYIRDQYASGASMVEVAAEYESSAASMYEIAKGLRYGDVGVPCTVRRHSNRKFTDDTASEIRALRENGYTIAGLATMFNTSTKTVHRIVYRTGAYA